MKKICFLTDSIFSIGGVQRVTAVIAEALSKDYEVTIATFDQEKESQTSLYELNRYPIQYQYLTYPECGSFKDKLCKSYSYLFRKHLPQNRISSYWYSRSSFPCEKREYLIKQLKSGHYDVIVAVHAFLAIRLATISKDLGDVKCIGWIHNSFDALIREGSPYLGPELKKHYGLQLKKLHDTVVLYHEDAEHYQWSYQFLPKVIYNPLTLTPGKPSQGTSKRFLAVGRFSPQHKGFDLLIQAFSRFAKNNSDWHLDIVGEGPEKEDLQQMVDEREMNSRIQLHLFTNEIQNYYTNASIYVLSSRWEGMPLVLVEAMSHGLPIIASDLPTCKEILGDFGIYFENGNIQQLAGRLEDATHINWQEKSEEALTIAQRFDVHQIVDQWKELIES